MSTNPRIAMVGPTPPPFAGMPTQLMRWVDHLRLEGYPVSVVSTRTDLRDRPLLRVAAFLRALMAALLRCDVINVHTGSDTSFNAFALPTVLLGRLMRCRVLVTYKGGAAAAFLSRSRMAVQVLRSAHAVLVPSEYLADVFRPFGLEPFVVPNILEPVPVVPARWKAVNRQPRLIVTRNLEGIYQVETALRAYAQVRRHFPEARLEVYGDGPERPHLETLVRQEQIGGVTFHGNVAPEAVMRALREADVFLNPSTVDNTPNSIVEALHMEVPVVSTRVGGIPYLLRHEESGLLVPPGNPEAMAQAAIQLIRDPQLAARLVERGRLVTLDFLWPRVFERFRAILQATGA